MTSSIIADTGPLVAFLNRRDRWHEWSVDTFKRLRPPLLTCESVVSEAAFLVRDTAGGAEAVLELLGRNTLQIDFALSKDLLEIRRLMRRYADVPMSLADACLVRMSEQVPRAVVLTLDDDFRRYRRRGRQVIPLLTPR